MLNPADLDHLNRQMGALADYLVNKGDKLIMMATALCFSALVVVVWVAVD